MHLGKRKKRKRSTEAFLKTKRPLTPTQGGYLGLVRVSFNLRLLPDSALEQNPLAGFYYSLSTLPSLSRLCP